MACLTDNVRNSPSMPPHTISRPRCLIHISIFNSYARSSSTKAAAWRIYNAYRLTTKDTLDAPIHLEFLIDSHVPPCIVKTATADDTDEQKG
eukprot:scaffold74622_cov64-Attheya_sp.AAC.2